MKIFAKFHLMSIRTKLLICYAATFFVSISIGNLVIYNIVRKTIEQNIEADLQQSTLMINNMIRTVADASIRNNLRAVAENNREVVQYFYELAEAGKISTKAAKEKAVEVLLSQIIGKSGYIYCLDSKGTIRVHPKKELLGADLTEHEFIQTQMEKKNGYIEYNWANPGEEEERSKAVYMVYFGPWDWIISASSYREEFRNLFNIEDFKDNILSLSFGKTGFPFVMTSKGQLIIHPKNQGKNILETVSANDRQYFQEICDTGNGRMEFWVNSSKGLPPRKNLIIYNYIPEFDWIVASSSFPDEFYDPLVRIGYSTLVTVLLMLLLVSLVTLLISNRIARPLAELIKGFEAGAGNNFSTRIAVKWGGEMDKVAEYYNNFMEQLQAKDKQLKESEEKFRGIFENAVEGIYQCTPDGKFITVNPAMALMLGFESSEKLKHYVNDLGGHLFADSSDKKEILKILEDHSVLIEYHTQYFRKDKSLIWCSLNAKAYKDENGKIKYIEGFITDITERKKTIEKLEKSHEDLEMRVANRTEELSKRIEELKQRNTESLLLREMSEMIQVSQDFNETYKIVSQYFEEFFPNESGQLFIFNKEHTRLESVVAWGDLKDEEQMVFYPNDCWSIRLGKPYLIKSNDEKLPCSHIPASATHGSLCVPMMAKGEIIGLLFIKFKEWTVKLSLGEEDHLLSLKQSLAVTIVEHLTLALINLHLQESLRIQSIQDRLTGLYNRRFLDESLKREAANIKRHKYSIGIIMIDVDFFKKFNDTYGHDCGDAVLRELGKLLKSNTRGEDIACRYGGEEFSIILVKTTEEGAKAKAETICRKVRDEMVVKHGGKIHKVTISMGVALCPEHAEEVEDVILAADAALYKAKENGRDRVEMAEKA